MNISEIIAAIDQANDDVALYKILDSWAANPSTGVYEEQQGVSLWRFADYFIRIGMFFNTDSLRYRLQKLGPLNLSCAPKFVHYNCLRDGTAILITQIPGFFTPGSAIWFNKVRFTLPDQSRSRFLDDIDKMLANKFMNEAIVRSTRNWYVVPDNLTIYIDDWSEINPVYATIYKQRIRNEIYEMLTPN